MIRRKNPAPLRRLFTAVLPILIVAAALAGNPASAAWDWSIRNPYAGVEWASYQQHKANFHTHTTMSDGSSTTPEVIDRYAALGYGVLVLTDHDTVGPGKDRRHPQRHRTTWPWEAAGRDPGSIGMVAVEGNEISRGHHIGSYFNDYGDPDVVSEDAAIEEIGRRGGLAVLFHPGRYRNPVEWYTRLYRAHPHLIGLEIYNQGNKYPDDPKRWDAVLAGVMAERPVWGFSSDDMHDPVTQLGRNWNLLLLPELSAEWVRRCMEDGSFFFVHAPDGHDGPAPPEIKSITVDSPKGVISIEASGHEYIEWISDGRTLHRGDRVDLSELVSPGGYIRAVIHGKKKGVIVGTQPFRIQPPAE